MIMASDIGNSLDAIELLSRYEKCRRVCGYAGMAVPDVQVGKPGGTNIVSAIHIRDGPRTLFHWASNRSGRLGTTPRYR